MKKTIFELIEKYMHSCMGDSAHDCEHIYRVLNNALVIAKEEQNVNYDILIAACLLHDIGRLEQIQNSQLCHAAVGCEKAYTFLVKNGFSESFAFHVKDCIRTHRFRKNDPPVSTEAKILFDADKLDVVGAIGIARTLAYQGTIGAAMYTRKEDGTISSGEDDTIPSFFREYHYKLKKLYDRFYTEKGAALALSRRSAAESFYQAILEEVCTFDQNYLQELK